MGKPMADREISRLRLSNHRLSRPTLAKPGDVVGTLCAVQAQDFAGAKWAVGARMRAATDAAVERAFNAGSILRTHILRPTWHFVLPADIRWLLALTAPRIKAGLTGRHRQLAGRAHAEAQQRRAGACAPGRRAAHSGGAGAGAGQGRHRS